MMVGLLDFGLCRAWVVDCAESFPVRRVLLEWS
jgi:hypothetical protein